MNITKEKIFKGCLIASISHAIMTNVYPELAYEQSWDGTNYSIQDSQGLRGTITFENDYCIGAFRNEESFFECNENLCEKILSTFPLSIIDVAQKETLQYMLIDNDGMIMPSVTSIFWADNTTIYYCESNQQSLKQDLTLISRILLPDEEAIKEWKNYYEMNNDSIELLKYLLAEKENAFSQIIILDDRQIKQIPGNVLTNECLESLQELNILIHLP